MSNSERTLHHWLKLYVGDYINTLPHQADTLAFSRAKNGYRIGQKLEQYYLLPRLGKRFTDVCVLINGVEAPSNILRYTDTVGGILHLLGLDRNKPEQVIELTLIRKRATLENRVSDSSENESAEANQNSTIVEANETRENVSSIESKETDVEQVEHEGVN